jgi:peptidylprolyl isomerase
VRRTAASLLAVSLLLLAGCSGESDDTASPSPSQSAATTATADPADVTALEAVTVSGAAGEAPTFDFEKPFSVSGPVARVAVPGQGDTVAEGDLVTLNVAAVSGEDGADQGGTYGADPEQLIATSSNIETTLLDALVGQQVGARILYANASSGTTMLISLEIMSTQAVPERAEGTAVTPAEGLPTVTLDADGKPSLTPVDGDAPTELVVQPLIQGAGAVVEAGQTLTVNYTGWLWDGTQFDSSWDRGAATSFSLSNVIQGWGQGLAGQTVGSQVLLIIPPELGYQDKAQGSIPANSTLVFVVDILAAS